MKDDEDKKIVARVIALELLFAILLILIVVL